MKYIITCLVFIILCACGADGEPEQPVALKGLRAVAASN
jgi:hypothetical protein